MARKPKKTAKDRRKERRAAANKLTPFKRFLSAVAAYETAVLNAPIQSGVRVVCDECGTEQAAPEGADWQCVGPFDLGTCRSETCATVELYEEMSPRDETL